jgi:hypothetical protein
VFWSRASPGYDPYGWLVWGYHALRLNLNLGGAPSWKPVTFLFTVPYSLAGHYAFRLWQITAVSVALAGPIVAGRIVYRVVADSSAEDQRWAAWAGAAFAGLCLLGIVQYTHYWLSDQSDPMLVTFVLLGIDMHLSRHHRSAFIFLCLASLGRPETWPFVGLYAIWCWREFPHMRRFLVGGILLIGFGWFIIPVFSGQSPFVAYQLAQASPRELHGNKVIGVFDRFRDLTFWPTKLAAGIALILAAWRRNLTTLVIAACSIVWVLVEVFFALRGLPGVPRYMFEAAAGMIVVAGIGVGWILAESSRLGRVPGLAGAAVVLAIVVLLVPKAHGQEVYEHKDLIHERKRTAEIGRLDAAIKAFGGFQFIRGCGDPSADVEWVSMIAWYTQLNVGTVGHRPQFEISDQDKPVVLFTALPNGWVVHTYHLLASDQTRCASLNNTYYIVTPQRPGGEVLHQS